MPALLFVGALFADEGRMNEAGKRLLGIFGNALLESPISPWDYSDYYRKELGWPLSKKFIFFDALIKEDALPEIKHKTRAIESELSIDGKRTVNLDPGYLTPAKVVLASTKDYSHRIYLGDGIYGEVTLSYKGDGFKPHMNTYRDYKDEKYMRLFENARALLKAKLKTGSALKQAVS